MTHKAGSSVSRRVRVLALTVPILMLAGCAGGDGARHLSDERYFDENPSSFDSDVYYDPFYGYRGTGEFRAHRKLERY